MRQVTLNIPTINDDPPSHDRLFDLWGQVHGDALHVRFDFSNCFFLQQNAVAFLGGLIRLIQFRGGRATVDWASLHEDVGRNLGKNGFRDAFGDANPLRTGESIPYRQDLGAERDSLADYLKDSWLGRGWVNVSPLLRDGIVGKVWEIYSNAFEHSCSPIGIFSCGQHYWRKKMLKLCVVDFGVGIPANVQQFAPGLELPPAKAMEWAFQAGTTTRPNGTGRGMGLDLLKQFVIINKGRLEVFSHQGYTVVTHRGERHATRPICFYGTLVNIQLVCDDKGYYLKSELPKHPLF